MRRLWQRLRAVFAPGRIDREVDEELRFHLDMRIAENRAAGMTPDEAEREARRRFGNLTSIAEEGREVRGAGLLDVFRRDLRIAARTLARRPTFTLAAVATLALGIGATTTVYSVVDAVLLRPPPFAESDRLVAVWETSGAAEDVRSASFANFYDWQSQVRSFSGMAASFTWSANLTGVDPPERLTTAIVTGGFFDVLGARPALGRALGPADDRADSPPVAVLGHGLWRRRFGGDPGIIGRTIALAGQSVTVVGVMAPDFTYPAADIDLWAPAGPGDADRNSRGSRFIRVTARLAPGESPASARANMDTIAARLAKEYPDDVGWTVRVAPLVPLLAGNARPPLLILLGAVACVLLVSNVNAANLLLARAAARRREMAIRVAVGAGRARLVAQSLTESLLLALLGAAAGTGLASLALEGVVAWNPGGIPRLAQATIDGRVLAVTLAITVGSAIACGLLPGLLVSRDAPLDALKREGGRQRTRLRGALVVSEIALALVLLVGAGLLMKSFTRLSAVAPGFDPENLLTLRVWLPVSKYRDNDRQIAFFQELERRLSALPGVRSVGGVQDLPLRKNQMMNELAIEGRPAPAGRPPYAAYRVVTPDYFATMGIPLHAGRRFDATDRNGSAAVVVVNDSLVARYFPDGSPLGRRLRIGADDRDLRTIVGVVGDVKHMGLDSDDMPAVYQPHAQKPEFLRWMTLAVRTEVEPSALIPAMRAAVQALDPDQPIFDVATMDTWLFRSVAGPRFFAALIGGFALIALLLAAVGVYGVLAFLVTQRTKEIGVRMALGARGRDVLRLVLGDALKLTLLGVVLGIGVALALTRVLASLLFEVSPIDVATFAAVPILLVGVAIAASVLPARRATRMSPLLALYAE